MIPDALTVSEWDDVAEILTRRANEIASFKDDLEARVARLTGQATRYEFPGSVELALSREMARLRNLAERIKAGRFEFPLEAPESDT